jgi:anti-sigma factor RsiW
MNEIVCASGVELLMDYLEGVLAADVRAALDEHVAGCRRCAAFVASYCATPRILRDATASSLPAGVEASLKAFLRARTAAFNSD